MASTMRCPRDGKEYASTEMVRLGNTYVAKVNLTEEESVAMGITPGAVSEPVETPPVETPPAETSADSGSQLQQETPPVETPPVEGGSTATEQNAKTETPENEF